MARVVGVDLPRNKKLVFALTYIYGIGPTRSREILEAVGLDPDKRTDELTDSEVSRLTEEINTNHQVEGDLRRMEGLNLKRLTEIGCYRGQRHRRGLPARGQRTKTNARTRRGRKSQPIKKKT